MSRLLEEYKNQIRQELKSKLDLKNIFELSEGSFLSVFTNDDK